MNDDLNLLVSVVGRNVELVKIALCVKGGLNNFDGWEWWREPSTVQRYRELIPNHIEYTFILEVVEINHIIQ